LCHVFLIECFNVLLDLNYYVRVSILHAHKSWLTFDVINNLNEKWLFIISILFYSLYTPNNFRIVTSFFKHLKNNFQYTHAYAMYYKYYITYIYSNYEHVILTFFILNFKHTLNMFRLSFCVFVVLKLFLNEMF